MSTFCTFPGCDNPPSPKAAKGLCNSHYWQLHKGRQLTPLSYRRNRCVPWLEAHAEYAGDECLIWPFQRANDGRGAVRVGGRQRQAAPVMCEMAHGPKPSAVHECAHSCGNGHLGCVNPKHLRWATHTENLADQIIHGTRCRGETQGSHKLTTADVLEIRRLAPVLSQGKLGKMFGVGQPTIGKVVRRQTWSHV